MNHAAQLRAFLRAQADPALAGQLLRHGAGAAPHYAHTSLRARANALCEAYPTVAHLLGGDGFEALSLAHARATPALDWDLNAYGGHLPRYIAAQQRDADGALLSDVARLDWAMHRAAFAPDAAPLDPGALAALASESQVALRLHPHPATALVVSAGPIAMLWQAARAGTEAAADGAAQSVLVGRDAQARTWLRALDAGEAAFTACLLAGGALGQGLEAALATAPGFDLAASLAGQIGDQVWSGHSVPLMLR